MRTPAALAALPLIAGAAAGLLLPDTAASLALPCAGAAVLCAVAALGAFGFDDGPDDGPLVVIGVVTGCLLAGASLGVSAARLAYAPSLLGWFTALDVSARGDPVRLEGVLREDASPGAYGWSLTMDVRRAGGSDVTGGVRLSVGGVPAADTAGEWRAGRPVRLPAILRPPAIYGNPGVPDESRALARRGIVLVGSVKSAALVEITAAGSVVDEAAAGARTWARGRLAADVGRWSAQSGAIASAILIGDRSGLSDEDQRRLQQAGTYHVIAISGGNIAILTVLLLGGLRILRVPDRAAAAAAIAVLLFYGRLTGGSPSVARAVAAASVFLAGRVLDHRGPALNALAVAAVAAVALSPAVVFDAGFILSFGASLGILLGTPRMPGLSARRSPHEHGGRSSGLQTPSWATDRLWSRAGRALVTGALALLGATVGAEAAILPVTAAVFSQVTFAGLALNFAAIPLMAIVQGASMATLAAAWVPAPDDHGIVPRAGEAAGYVTHVAALWLVGSASLVDHAPWLSRDVPAPAWSLTAAYYAGAVVCVSSIRFARAGLSLLVACAAAILFGASALTRDAVPPPPQGSLRVVFLDVGQGDSTLVLMPGGRTLLVDAGGLAGSTFDIGDRVVSPALRAFGVRALDAVVLTHGDPDHIGGAPAILRRFRPPAIWEGVPVPAHVRLRDLARAAASAGATWRSVQAGDREVDGPVEIRVLHPPPPDWERPRVRNEDSIVLEIRMGDVSIVLPGDIGPEGERALAPHLAPNRIVVVKAPHHGSASSSTEAFIRATHPSAVVFSAGRGNRFGHPAPAVVERYRLAGAQMLRTAEQGAIILDTDGRSLTFTPW